MVFLEAFLTIAHLLFLFPPVLKQLCQLKLFKPSECSILFTAHILKGNIQELKQWFLMVLGWISCWFFMSSCTYFCLLVSFIFSFCNCLLCCLGFCHCPVTPHHCLITTASFEFPPWLCDRSYYLELRITSVLGHLPRGGYVTSYELI